MSVFLDLKITAAGKQAAFNAASTGIDVEITHVAFGDRFKEPSGTETALVNEIKRVAVGGGYRVSDDQVRIWGLWSGDADAGQIREVGIYAGAVLFAYYSRAEGSLIGQKTPGGDFVFYYDWKLSEIPTEVISIVIDPSAATAIAVLAVHEKDLMAHNHFMRRAAMAQEGEQFRWGGLADGTSTVIELTLPPETLLTSYVAGQTFRFVAKEGNSGPVGLKINGLELRSVRKYGQTALVSGDLLKGCVYEVTFDGSNFQLNSGIGGSAEVAVPEGDVFFVHSFTATAGQTSFEVVYNVGALMVFRGGAIVQPEDFTATDGLKVVFPTGSTAGQEVVVVTFRALAASNVYTKPQTYSRAEIGSLLNDKQNALGFTPVQQGGGIGQFTNKVRIGWGGENLLAQVDTTALGNFWLSSNFDPSTKRDIGGFLTFDGSVVLTPAQMGTVRINAPGGASVTLPSSLSVPGQDILIRRIDSASTGLYVHAAPGEYIRMHLDLNFTGYPFTLLMGNGDWWHLRSDGGGGWWPIGRHDTTQLGQISMVSRISVAPGGYGATNGALLSRSLFPWLWDFAKQSGMLIEDRNRAGNEGCWTAGDGSKTFRVPDIRGEFIRVLDEYRGVDVNRTPGSWKADEVRRHTHTPPNQTGLNTEGIETGAKALGGLTSGTLLDVGYYGGDETRPRSIALPARIKLI